MNKEKPSRDKNKINSFFKEIKSIIEKSRQNVAVAVNSAMTQLYWNIGKLIKEEILQNSRAEYGKKVILALSSQLTREYGKGWSEKQLRHCLRIAETFNDFQIVSTLSRQLSWSHLKELIYVDDPLKREFYTEMCKLEKSNIKIAEYLTQLPDIKVLKRKLHQSIAQAKNRLTLKEKNNE